MYSFLASVGLSRLAFTQAIRDTLFMPLRNRKDVSEKRFVCTGYGCKYEKKIRTARYKIECEMCGRVMKIVNKTDDKKGNTSNVEDGGNGTLKTVGEEVDGEKTVFICRECSLRTEKGPKFTSTKCPECGQKLDLKGRASQRPQNSTGRSGEATEKKGYVYVMVNSAKPNMVKIGMTERNPEKRAEELSSSTGVAVPYVVAYEAATDRPKEVEKAVHDRLSEERVNPDREFFGVKAKRAIEVIEQQI